MVRAAAVSALGRYNGSVVAVDPTTGRNLTVVNQKIAFGEGYIPCSTIKPTIALAALEENVITRDTMLKVGRRKYMNLTEAMAHSNNVFFEQLGSRMGFETVSKYRSEEHTSELQSQSNLVCRLLLEKKKTKHTEVGLSRLRQLRTSLLPALGRSPLRLLLDAVIRDLLHLRNTSELTSPHPGRCMVGA